jgi:GntR family transcriptional repressor for pyruvate dehydrogenase complex
VSRTVLREAMARLKSDGIIDAQQGRGSFVLRHSLRTPFRFDLKGTGALTEIVQLGELRLGVEGVAAALAATRRTEKHLERLKSCIDRMRTAVRKGTDGTAADLEFHQTIADATRNDHCKAFMLYLRQFFISAIGAARTNSAQIGISQQAQSEHEAIFRAIDQKNPLQAEKAMKRHIQNAMRRLTVNIR